MEKRRWTQQEIRQWLDENHRFIYANPMDQNLFIRKHYGISWTLNWGNPAAWMVLTVFVVLTVLLVFFLKANI